MKSRIPPILSLAAIIGLALAAASDQAAASTVWTNALADGDINNAGNWSSGLPSDASHLGVIVSTTPLVINQVFTNGGDDRSEFLITGTAGMTVEAGASLTYFGDGLVGSTIASAGGASTVTQTGGTLTQDGGGAGLLVGHNAVGTYNISGGNLLVQGAAPSLTIDFNDSGAADPDADGSSLNISGTGQVDVETGVNLVVNSGGTLNVTGGGLLVWLDRSVAEATFAGTVNAAISQVGSDVHFTAVFTPSGPFAITEIEHHPDAEPDPTVTLTWRKTGAASYIARYSTDMGDWLADLDDSITEQEDIRPEDTKHITVAFPLKDGLELEEDLFFRIEEG